MFSAAHSVRTESSELSIVLRARVHLILGVRCCGARQHRAQAQRNNGARYLGHQMEERMKLVWPSREYLPSYVAALERGWSPDNVRGLAGSAGRRPPSALRERPRLPECTSTPAPERDGFTLPPLDGVGSPQPAHVRRTHVEE
jgi:hypothetical protein